METVSSEESLRGIGIFLRRKPLHGIRPSITSDPGRQIHGSIMNHFRNVRLLRQPLHSAEQLCTCLIPSAVRGPSNALYRCRFLGGHDQLFVKCQCSSNTSIHFDHHPESYADFTYSSTFSRSPENSISSLISCPTEIALPACLTACMIRKVWPVYPSIYVGSQRVCDEVAVSCLNDENGGIGSDK